MDLSRCSVRRIIIRSAYSAVLESIYIVSFVKGGGDKINLFHDNDINLKVFRTSLSIKKSPRHSAVCSRRGEAEGGRVAETAECLGDDLRRVK
jgi:hypothetical protein